MIKNRYSWSSIFLKHQSFWFGSPFWAFAIINTPSLKLLYFSPLVNLIAIIGLYGSYILEKSQIYTDKVRITCLTILTLLWGILFISGAFGTNAVVYSELLLRYISVYVALIALIFFIRKKDVPQIIGWQIIWGTALALYQIIFQFSFSELSESIHYNTIAIPIASSLVAILAILFFAREKVKNKPTKIVLWFCLVINLLGISSLSGRGPLIYPLVTILLFWLLKLDYSAIFKLKKLFNFLKVSVTLSFLGYLAVNNIQTRLSGWAIERYELMFTQIEQEPRIKLYKTALEAIINNPWGYGLNGSDNIVGFYPHNIFLEILLSAGIFGLLPFLIFVVWYFRKIRYAASQGSDNIPLAMVSCYLFLTWNTSFDLASSYVCIGSMAMFICSSTRTKKYKKITMHREYIEN